MSKDRDRVKIEFLKVRLSFQLMFFLLFQLVSGITGGPTRGDHQVCTIHVGHPVTLGCVNTGNVALETASLDTTGSLLEPFSGVEIHIEMEYRLEMDGNGAQFVKGLWIGLDLGKTISLKRYDRYRTSIKHDINNSEGKVISQEYSSDSEVCVKFEALDTSMLIF